MSVYLIFWVLLFDLLSAASIYTKQFKDGTSRERYSVFLVLRCVVEIPVI